MRRIWMSTLLAALLLVVLVFTVYSQAGNSSLAEVKILQGGVAEQIPIDVTLLVPTESGVQTVTVPLMINLNLSIGPVDVVDMDVTVSQGRQFISPITSVEPVSTEVITATSEITSTGGE